MSVSIEIKNCGDCMYLEHSGAFTPGGAKPVCNGPDAVDTFTKNKKVNSNKKRFPDDKYHWRHRVIRDTNKIHNHCPLKPENKS